MSAAKNIDADITKVIYKRGALSVHELVQHTGHSYMAIRLHLRSGDFEIVDVIGRLQIWNLAAAKRSAIQEALKPKTEPAPAPRPMVIKPEIQARANKVSDLAKACGLVKRHGYDEIAHVIFLAWQAEDRKLKAMCS